MYHSVASLIADGTVLVTGSNPNGNYRKADGILKYPTEYVLKKKVLFFHDVIVNY